MNVNGVENKMRKGDILMINMGDLHSFTTNTGAIFEEISTEHISDDSYYTDSLINKNQNIKI